MISIPADVLAQIRAHGTSAYPEECVGALLGEDAPSGKIVRAARPVVNARTEERRRRYLVPAEAYRAVEETAREEGLDVLGFYHSHPDHPARPSEYDREHAWPWYSYVIVGVERGAPGALTSWVLRESRDRFDEEEIQCP